MKFFLLIVLVGCSILKTKNLDYVQVGMDEKLVLADFWVKKVSTFGEYRFIPINDGIVVTKDSKVIDKFPLKATAEITAELSPNSTAVGKKFTYFIEANERMVDPKSIYFTQVKEMVKRLLEFKGNAVTANRKEAEAIVRVGYGVTSFLSKGFSNDPLNLMTRTTYNRFAHLSAYEVSKPDVNIWESRVESKGEENDAGVFVPGHLAALENGINQQGTEIVQVQIDKSDVLMNYLLNPQPFEKYIRAQ
ncbi:MAG: hypothetical protein V4598_18950 [Bdellovibrionota bacterium]